jgi:Zn-dependent protease with chaperone function
MTSSRLPLGSGAALCLFVLLLFPSLAVAQAASGSSTQASSPVTAYTLSPERYKQAHELGHSFFVYQLVSFVYTVILLALILRSKLGLTFQTLAERLSKRRLVQAFVFTPLMVGSLILLLLPTDVYRHWLSLHYGLSIQGWTSWLWDWTKFQLVLLVLTAFLSWLLYLIINKSPRRWWLYFWLASLPMTVGLIFLQPLIFDPLFHKFEMLSRKNPTLAVELQRLVSRAGETIPNERMFWMEAGNKTTTLNAYVTGFGASKRIVVWDTTIAKMSTPQIVFVAGHEMGHYVLQHIVKGLLSGALLTLVAFFAGRKCAIWLIAQKGKRWGIGSVGQWSSMPVLLLLVIVFSFVLNPIVNAISRHYEHQADQYGLEVTHSLTPDSGQVGAQAFQILGEVGLGDPDPNPVDVFMFYDHPPIADRVRFSLTYQPWISGGSPEFVK